MATRATPGKSVNAKTKLTIQSKAIPKAARKKRLPRGLVKLVDKDCLEVDVEKLATSVLRDQRANLISSDGCISNPGGPSC